MEFQVGDRVRASSFPNTPVGEVAKDDTSSQIRVEYPTGASRLFYADELTLVARPVYMTPEQIAALIGCIDAAENDGYFEAEVALARGALGEVKA